jgi:Tat protein secretion system quality control protein TatD with DNase activity
VRNEPAHLAAAVRAIAEIKKLPEEEVVRAVGENARRLYRM